MLQNSAQTRGIGALPLRSLCQECSSLSDPQDLDRSLTVLRHLLKCHLIQQPFPDLKEGSLLTLHRMALFFPQSPHLPCEIAYADL